MVNQKFKAQSFHGFNIDQNQIYQQQQQQQQQQHHHQQGQVPQQQAVPLPPQLQYNNTTDDPSENPYNQLRHISLPTYAGVQTYPRLVRASSLNNDLDPSGSKIDSSNPEHQKFLNVKVTCEFQGDINSMTMNWTPKEIENSRRLVLINFKQNFNHLTLSFRPIDQSDYIPGIPVISCIYWAEANKFYVTSVDLITLLEYLVNSKFPVEEKNRIRRNLQSLKPLTISKSNPKFYQFFQLIMNFQNPKPRHIEKDVKVLLWSSLKDSLQKVLSKYTIDPTISEPATSSSYNTTTSSDSKTSTSTIPTTTTTGSSSKDMSSSFPTLPQVQESYSNMPQYYHYQNLPPPPPQQPQPPPPSQSQSQPQQPHYQLQPMFPNNHMYQLPNISYQDQHYESLPAFHQQPQHQQQQLQQSPMQPPQTQQQPQPQPQQLSPNQLQQSPSHQQHQQHQIPQNNYMYYYQ